MPCARNCTGISICEGSIACIQFQQGAGNDCLNIPEGFSRIQINEDGDLEVCSNVGGICTCEAAAGGDISTVVDNDDGTVTHDDGTGNVTVLDICKILKDAYEEGANWQTLGLNAGWATEEGMQPLEFRCLCTGEVQLRGCIEGTPAGGELPASIGVVPINNGVYTCRPPATIRFGGAGCASIEIDPSGNVSTNPSTTPTYRCFDGLTYYTA